MWLRRSGACTTASSRTCGAPLTHGLRCGSPATAFVSACVAERLCFPTASAICAHPSFFGVRLPIALPGDTPSFRDSCRDATSARCLGTTIARTTCFSGSAAFPTFPTCPATAALPGELRAVDRAVRLGGDFPPCLCPYPCLCWLRADTFSSLGPTGHRAPGAAG